MITVKKDEQRWKVTFWNGPYNDIKTIYVLAKSKDEAIYNACEKTNLRSIANEPSICL